MSQCIMNGTCTKEELYSSLCSSPGLRQSEGEMGGDKGKEEEGRDMLEHVPWTLCVCVHHTLLCLSMIAKLSFSCVFSHSVVSKNS